MDGDLARAFQVRADAARAHLGRIGADAWLCCDFQGRNPIFWQLLGQPRHTTRRCYLVIPREGAPRMLAHRIDLTALRDFGIETTTYLTWREHGPALAAHLGAARRVAMDYAPGGGLPVISRVDGGTLDAIRALGLEVVSSADLVQAAVAAWSERDLSDHLVAAERIHAALFDLFAAVRAGDAAVSSEYAAQQYLLAGFARRGLTTEDPPIVAVNAHASDPHFEPSARHDTAIRAGDFVLVDLWARVDRPGTVYADSTWVATVGRPPSPREVEVFESVRRARDAGVALLQRRHADGATVAGWEVDRIVRQSIDGDGFGASFTHRTGHSLGQQVHGPGVNLDDFETQDVRTVGGNVAVTIEPGIYLPEFGVRSEINVFAGVDGPRVTTAIQTEITALL